MGAKQKENQTKKAGKTNDRKVNSSNQSSVLLFLGTILLLGGIAFSPSLKNGFTNWDDNVYVAENPLLTSLVNGSIKAVFSTSSIVSNNYHPITILSLAIDYKFAGFSPKAYHFTNLLFHLLNIALVFWFVFLLTDKKLRPAAIVAFFFGVHPMHVESVAWIAERKDVLYVFFFVASLICYLKYLSNSTNKKWFLYALMLFLFLLSILSKAMAVVLPLTLLLIDYYKGRKFDKRVLLEKVPFFILSIVFGILASKVQSGAIANIETFTLLQRFAFASYGMVEYIVKLFLPINLSCFYPYPNLVDDHLPWLFYVVPIVAILLIGLTFFLFRRSNRVFVFGFGFYLVTVALVLQFVSVGQVIMADRYSYLSYVGLLFPVAMGFEWLQGNTDNKWSVLKKISVPLILMLAGLSAFYTFQRTKVWKNSDTLWTDAINKYPSSEPFRNRGSYLVNKAAYDKGEKRVGENEYDRALKDFDVSIGMNPKNAKVFINRANIYGLKQQFDLALNDYSKAIELDKTDPQTYFNRGITYSMMKQYEKAAEDYTTVLTMKPDMISAKQNRAYVYADNGNYDKAIADLNDVIKNEPTNPVNYFYRGFSYYKLNNLQAALEDNSLAIQYNPSYDAAYFNRSVINKGLGKSKEALQDAEKAKELGYAVNDAYLNELKRLNRQ